MPESNQVVKCRDSRYFSGTSCYLNLPAVFWDSTNQRWLQKRPSVNALDSCSKGKSHNAANADNRLAFLLATPLLCLALLTYAIARLF